MIEDVASVTAIVRARIAAHRDHGVRAAFERASRELGVSPRRARSYWLRQVRTLQVAEYRGILRGALACAERDRHQQDAARAALEARLRALDAVAAGQLVVAGWDGVERRASTPLAVDVLTVCRRARARVSAAMFTGRK